jgi:phospho-N-acetylmuramoyl-pentapeptide-transferase
MTTGPFSLLLVPALIAGALALVGGAPLIAWLRSRRAEQPISPDAPEKHRLKHGTPTMGGLLVIAATLLALLAGVLLFPVPSRRFAGLVAVGAVFLAGGAIGVLDDLGKARRRENKAGLSERVKLALQLAVGIGFAAGLHATGFRTIVAGVDLGMWFWPLVVLFVVGYGNAANFTDGLDGLLGGTGAVVAGALGMVCMGGSDRPETTLFCGAVAGACLGFLWWNAFPARVFAGDTGSLALGMGLAAAAVVSGQAPVFVVLTVIWIAEIGSMMLQRYVFKWRRIRHGLEYAKANRVFRRAPLHHHFEEGGWHETQVTMRFVVVSLAAAGLVLCWQ